MRQTLDPKLDVVFKLLFADERNKALLISLLNAVLRPPSPILDLVVLNPELPKEATDERGAVLDVRARLADGTQIDLELQARHHPGLRERELFYWARMYTTQIGRGDDYLELKPTICIFILNFSDSDSPRFHSIFRVLEIHDHREFSQDLEIHTLELPKLEEEAAHDPDSPVLKWGRFFRATTDEELEKLAMADPDMNAAKQALDRLSADPKAQQLAEDRELAIWNLKRTVKLAEQQAEARGKAEGEARGKVRGKAEGKAEALRDVLAKLLTLKFGGVSEEVRDRIQRANETEVSRWTERVLSASSVDAVFQN